MSPGQLRIGRVAGFAVAVHWSVLVIVALLTWALAGGLLPQAAPGHPDAVYVVTGLTAAALLLGAILVHELAHALAARRAGVAVDSITLWVLGGVSVLRGEAATASAELRIALSGPAASAGVALLAAATALVLPHGSWTDLLITTAWWLALVNAVLVVFNLIPGSPLDGGRALRALVWWRTGDRDRATLVATQVGVSVATGLVATGAALFVLGYVVDGAWIALIGWYVLTTARAERAWVSASRLLEGITVAQVMSAPVETASADATVEEFITRQVLTGHHSALPLVDVGGRVVGLVTLRALHGVPVAQRPRVRVRDVAVPVDRLAVARPDEPVSQVLARVNPGTGSRALVIGDGGLLGIVSTADLNRLLALRGLQTEVDR